MSDYGVLLVLVGAVCLVTFAAFQQWGLLPIGFAAIGLPLWVERDW